MTPTEFCYWLNGFAELMRGRLTAPDAGQWQAIIEHLERVFAKVTPPTVPPEAIPPKPGTVTPLTPEQLDRILNGESIQAVMQSAADPFDLPIALRELVDLHGWAHTVVNQAADDIERLRAENASLRRALSEEGGKLTTALIENRALKRQLETCVPKPDTLREVVQQMHTIREQWERDQQAKKAPGLTALHGAQNLPLYTVPVPPDTKLLC